MRENTALIHSLDVIYSVNNFIRSVEFGVCPLLV